MYWEVKKYSYALHQCVRVCVYTVHNLKNNELTSLGIVECVLVRRDLTWRVRV